MKRTIVFRSDELETQYELIKAATDLGVTEGLSNIGQSAYSTPTYAQLFNRLRGPEITFEASDVSANADVVDAAYEGAFEAVEKYITNKPKDEPEKPRTTDIVMLAIELNAECKKTKCNECPFSKNICTCRLAYDRPNHWQLDGLRGRRNENE